MPLHNRMFHNLSTYLGLGSLGRLFVCRAKPNHGALQTNWERRLQLVHGDPRSSAWTLFRAGIDWRRRGDAKAAKICFGLAEKLFVDADEDLLATVAHDWYESLPPAQSAVGD